jgi:lipoate-protein ligase A
MAVDRALLCAARTPAIRLYSWSPPGVSLGWFQRGIDSTRYEDAGYQVVRRLTGGGAVVHHHEVTYAIVLPLAHPSIAGLSVLETYGAIHAPVREALESLGVAAMGRAGDLLADRESEPELCFERASPFDVLVAGRKVVGSAQRRLPDRVLQHGSIVLGPNPLQPAQPSLARVAGRPLSGHDLALALERSFRAAFGPTVAASLTSEEEDVAAAAGAA